MWNSTPPPFMEKNILNFHFYYLTTRLIMLPVWRFLGILGCSALAIKARNEGGFMAATSADFLSTLPFTNPPDIKSNI